MADVSLHAMRRWLERVEGIDLSGYFQNLKAYEPGLDGARLDGAVVDAALSATGRTRADLVAEILSPVVHHGAALGASRIKLGNGARLVCEDGVICTVLNNSRTYCPPDLKRRRKRGARRRRRTLNARNCFEDTEERSYL